MPIQSLKVTASLAVCLGSTLNTEKPGSIDRLYCTANRLCSCKRSGLAVSPIAAKMAKFVTWRTFASAIHAYVVKWDRKYPITDPCGEEGMQDIDTHITEYNPREHRLDWPAVSSAFVLLVVVLAGMVLIWTNEHGDALSVGHFHPDGTAPATLLY